MVRFSSAIMLLASLNSSAVAFAPGSMGSAFVQTRTGFTASSSTNLKMNLFDRFSRVAKANINNVLKNLEDPEKILNQAVEDMQVRYAEGFVYNIKASQFFNRSPSKLTTE